MLFSTQLCQLSVLDLRYSILSLTQFRLKMTNEETRVQVTDASARKFSLTTLRHLHQNCLSASLSNSTSLPASQAQLGNSQSYHGP